MLEQFHDDKTYDLRACVYVCVCVFPSLGSNWYPLGINFEKILEQKFELRRVDLPPFLTIPVRGEVSFLLSESKITLSTAVESIYDATGRNAV